MEQDTRTSIIAAIALTILVVIGLVAYGIYTSVTNSGKVPVEVSTVPADAKVTLNDTAVKQGTVYLEPGSYVAKVTKDGFAEYTNTFTIDESRRIIPVALAPESDEARTWAEENKSDYRELEAKGGEASNQAGEAFEEKNPITAQLPYENLLYSVGYKSDPSDASGESIIIDITAPEGYRQAAIYRIHQLGYDPTDFKINFNDYKNPFVQ